MEEKLIGKIVHFYGNISVGIIELSDSLKVGETVHIKGHTSDFTQQVSSMQIEHAKVQEATKGQAVGIKVADHVRVNDTVYKVFA